MDGVTDFRPVPGYEGRYEVSSCGQVRSIKRGKLLSQHISDNGYPRTGLSLRGRMRIHHVHSLVALAFIGPRPIGLDVNHIDGNKENNRVSNLEYVTRSQNCRHACAIGLRSMSGDSNPLAKLTADDVVAIRLAITKPENAKKRSAGCYNNLAHKFGVHKSTIYQVVANRSYKNISVNN